MTMTYEEAKKATEFIAHPILRARTIYRLEVGLMMVCPDCGQLADTAAGCWPCDEAKFTAQAEAYDAKAEAAETETGTDPHARY